MPVDNAYVSFPAFRIHRSLAPGFGALACAWFATRHLQNIWLRGFAFSVIVGLATATVTGFMPHSGEVQMPAILIVIAEAEEGAMEWAAIRNILLVSTGIWALSTLICDYAQKHRTSI